MCLSLSFQCRGTDLNLIKDAIVGVLEHEWGLFNDEERKCLMAYACLDSMLFQSSPA